MPTTFYTGADAGNSWSDPGNWTSGVPGPGSTALIGIFPNMIVNLNNVTLDHVEVTGTAELFGGAVGLTDSQITPLPNGDIDIHNSGLWLDPMSFIGVAPGGGGSGNGYRTWVNVFTPTIINQGIIGAEAPHSVVEVVGGNSPDGIKVLGYGPLINAGQIVASNGGYTYLATENVAQVGAGTMNILSGGTMEAWGSIIQGGSINFGGADSTILRLALNDTIGAVLKNFAVTDQVQLSDFKLSSYSESQTGGFFNPTTTLHVSGTDTISGAQGTLNLTFQGNLIDHLHVESAPVNGLPGAKVFLS